MFYVQHPRNFNPSAACNSFHLLSVEVEFFSALAVRNNRCENRVLRLDNILNYPIRPTIANQRMDPMAMGRGKHGNPP
jgi:hypothetical protein